MQTKRLHRFTIAITLGLGMTLAFLLLVGVRLVPDVQAHTSDFFLEDDFSTQPAKMLHSDLADSPILPRPLAINSNLPEFTAITSTVFSDDTVININCTLREAIIAANTDTAVDNCPAGSGADTINLVAGTYVLTVTGISEDAGLTGDLDITDLLTIIGQGPDSTIIDATGLNDRGLHILNTTVTISGVTIKGGSGVTQGGGVSVNSGDLTLENSQVISNSATNGGGVYIVGATAAVTLTNGTIATNTANTSGGGIYISTGTANLTGGDIFSNTADGTGGGLWIGSGSATLSGTQVISNRAVINGGGVYLHQGSATLSAGQIAYNTADADGAGVYLNQSSAALTQTNISTIAYNIAADDGGGIYANNGNVTLSGGQILSNTAQGNSIGDGGGGIFVAAGNVSLSGGQIISNSARDGGGLLLNSATATFTQTGVSTITGNTASDRGGGVYVENGTMVMTNGQIDNNTANDHGGGIYVLSGQANLSSSQIFTNTATTLDGGGLYNRNVMNLTNMTLSGNQSGQYGGGLFNRAGTTTLTNTTIINNQSTTHGGGILNDTAAGSTLVLKSSSVISNQSGTGGGIYNNQQLTLTNSRVDLNTSTNGGAFGGGGIYNSGSSAVLTLTNTSVSTNVAQNHGGGIYNTVTGTVTLNNVTVSSNTTVNNGGGLYNELSAMMIVTGSTVSSNTTRNNNGGGFFNDTSATLIISYTIIVSNSALGNGGGIDNGNSQLLQVSNSTVHSNTAGGNGGGIYNGTPTTATISSTTVSNNQANNGGGLWNDALLTLVNSTLSGNNATSIGGGFLHNGGTSLLTHTTISSNTASTTGGGIMSNSGGMTLLNTIVANSSNGDCAGAVLTSNGYNLASDGTCLFGTTGDQNNTNPLLGPLQDNGGPSAGAGSGQAIKTHALLSGSPAIDAGDCHLTADQRGFVRPNPISSFCDIGAFESNMLPSVDLAIAKTVTPATASPGDTITYTLTFTNNGPGVANGVVITDAAPVPTVTVGFITASGVPITPTSFGPIYAWDVLAPMLPGEGGIITIPAQITTSLSGSFSFTNTAVITGSGDITPGNDTASVGLTVTASGVDLQISKSDTPDPVQAGANLIYTLRVTNSGSTTATGVVVTDTLPPEVTFVSAEAGQGGCSQAGSVVTCTTDMKILLVDDDGNSPNVRSNYTNALDALGYTYDIFDVSVSGNPANTLMSAYSVVIWFTGQTEAPDGTDENELATYLAGGGKLFLSSQDYNFVMSTTLFMQNYLGVASVTDDSTAGVVAGVNDFAGLGPYATTYPFTDYSDDLTPNITGTVAFTSSNAPNVAINTTNTVFFAFPWEAIQNNNAANGQEVMQAVIDYLISAAGGLGINQPLIITLTTTVNPAAGGVITNTVEVAGDQSDPQPVNNTTAETTTILAGAGLGATKRVDKEKVALGMAMTYTVIISNQGSISAANTVMTDTIPTGAAYITNSLATQGSPPAVFGGSAVTWVGTVTNSQAVTFTFQVSVTGSSGYITNTALISHPSLTTALTPAVVSQIFNKQDYLYTNETDVFIPDDSCTTIASSAIVVPDSFIVDDVRVGINLDHTQRDHISATLQSPLGTQVSIVSSSSDPNDNYDILLTDASGNTPDDGDADDTGIPFYERDVAPASALSTFAGENAAGTWTLFICDLYSGDTGLLNQWSLFFDQAAPAIDLSLSKTVDPTTASGGKTITYSLIFANNGPITATGVVITDTPPLPTVTVTGISSSGVAITQTGGPPIYTFDVDSLWPGAVAMITLTAQITTNLSNGIIFTNTATITGNGITGTETDTDTTNNTSLAWVATPGDCQARVNGIGPIYTTVQAAVDAATNSTAVVHVAGYCSGVEGRGGLTQTAYISKSLTLRGGYTTTNWTVSDPVANPTTLDAQSGGRVVYIVGSINVELENLRLTGGNATSLGGAGFGGVDDAGGGVYVLTATVMLTNNLIYSNSASTAAAVTSYGGGLYLGSGQATLVNNIIQQNQASLSSVGNGGGLYLEDNPATLINNQIIANTGGVSDDGSGGGLFATTGGATGLTLSANIIRANIGGNSAAGFSAGGGVLLEPFMVATLTNNIIQSNTANIGGGKGDGGGIYLNFVTAVLSGNQVISNTAGSTNNSFGGGLRNFGNSVLTIESDLVSGNSGGQGAGLYLGDAQIAMTNAVIINNTLTVGTGRLAAGMYLDTTTLIARHLTLSSNSGGDGSGIYVTGNGIGFESQVNLTNTIIVSHTVGLTMTTGGGEVNSVILDGVLWFGNTLNTFVSTGTITVTNAITGNPAFAADGYHLTSSSAAIDQGVATIVTNDIDGEVRPQQTGPDLGADELPFAQAAPDISISKTVTPTTVTSGQTITFTLTFSNVGGTSASGVVITDIVPGQVNNLSYITSGVTITQTAGVTFSWTVQDLGVSQSGFITITGQVSATVGTVVVNTATITATGDTNGANNSATAGVMINPLTADLELSKRVYASNYLIQDNVKITHNLNGGPSLVNSDFFGWSMSEIGDLNGDGVLDIAVGSTMDDTGGAGSNRGAVYALFMKADGTVSSSVKIAHNINGGPSLALGDRFGASVSEIGDLNGDGIIDMAVGANYDDAGGNARGALYVLFMKADGTVNNSVKIAHNTNGGPSLADNDWFGGSVSGIGDLNGDGVLDIAVGASQDDTGGNARGALYALFMKADGTVSSSVKIAHNAGGGPSLVNSDRFGISVSGIGDLNGDGVLDMAVGANLDDTGGSDKGAVYVLFMKADGTVSSSVKIAHNINGGPSLANDNWFGTSVSEIGDLNGDGVIDMAVGAAADDTGGAGSNRGAVYALFMKADGTVNSSLKIAHNTNGGPSLANDDFFGKSVSGIGDLNGDGVLDIAVGANYDDTGGSDRGAVYVLFGQAQAQAGETITYTLTFTNSGNGTAAGVVITDIVPLTVTNTSVASSGVTLNQLNAGSITYTWQVQDLGPNEGGVITISGQIDPNISLSATFTNTAEITTTTPEASAGNNIHNGVVTVVIPTSYCYATPDNGTTVYQTSNAQAVQQAVDAASAGNTIKIAGTCAGVQLRNSLTQSVYIDKALTLRGGYTTTNWTTSDPVLNPTVLDAQSGGRVVYVAAGTSMTIEKLSLISGSITGNGGGIYHNGANLTLLTQTIVSSNTATGDGGGVYVNNGSMARLDGGEIVSNTADNGGGVFVDLFSGFTQTNGFIAYNKAAGRGGGVHIFDSVATLNGGQIFSNTATRGGGVFINNNTGLTTLSGVYIISNTAAGDSGGGIYVAMAAVGGGVTITGGQIASNMATLDGGGLYIERDQTTLDGGQIISNTAGNGGGVYVNDASAVFSQTGLSTIAYNTAITNGGGIFVGQGSAAFNGGQIFSNTATNGGGIYNTSYLTLDTNSTIVSNTAGIDGGGIYNANSGSVATLDGVAIDRNSAVSGGGGLYNLAGGTVNLTGVTISNNSSDFGGGVKNNGGQVMMTGSAVVTNSAASGGGGIYNSSSSGVITLTNTTISTNTSAGHGGGIYVAGGTVSLTGSLVTSNTATINGGGLYGGDLLLTNTVISWNKGDQGGGILVLGMITLSSGTVSSNTATSDGGGIFFFTSTGALTNSTVSGNTAVTGVGGGLYNNSSTLLVAHTTIAGNSAASGAGGLRTESANSILKHTIVAGNGVNCENIFGGVLTSNGYNLSSDTSCTDLTATGDITNIDPLLGPLQDNGGKTETHDLLPGSPAIDAGDPGFIPPPNFDQRGSGFPRVQGGRIDIGAIESLNTLTLTVNSANDVDDGACDLAHCSLREAMNASNSNTNVTNTIAFSIPGAGPHVITPTTDLPNVTTPVIIDGSTEPGASCTAWPPTLLIELDATNTGVAGLTINAGNSTVRGLAIHSSNGEGIRLDSNGGNVLECNFIGTDASGTVKIGNASDGVRISGTANNRIGGTGAVSRNVMAGNQNGIVLDGSGATSNIIQGNYIGANAGGTLDFGNAQDGIRFNGAPGNLVGGAGPNGGNLVSGNDGSGIFISGITATINTIFNNRIGTNVAGTAAVSNTANGITIDNAPGNVISSNLVSGNGNNGIVIVNSGATGNILHFNRVGVNAGVTAALSNTQIGILIEGGASNNIIGGTAAGQGNLISGNGGHGIGIRDSSTVSNTVQGNYIGVDASATGLLANNGAGINLDNTSNNLIGGTAAGAGNLISGNRGDGLKISNGGSNTVAGNYIGTDVSGAFDLGNGLNGILIFGSTNNTIGGSAATSNTIAFNGNIGVNIFSGTNNAILSNAIYSNTGLGIDLGSNGVTANDGVDDVDIGPNDLQNFPILNSVTIIGGNIDIVGTLAGTVGTTYTVEFFANTVCDPAGYGEGELLRLTDIISTSTPPGVINFNKTITADPGRPFISATATDPNGNTSEFSACVPVSFPTDLSIVKTINTPIITVRSQIITYTVTVTNNGPGIASDIVITDTPPIPTLTLLSIISSGVNIVIGSPAAYTFSVTNMMSGAVGILTFTAQVTDTVANGTIFTNTITITSAAVDTNTTNNTAVISALVNIPIGVLINESASGTFVAEGGTTDSYGVSLVSQPLAPVTVIFNPDAQLSTNAPQFTFDSGNWNIPQTLVVTAVDDFFVEPTPHPGIISHTAVSSDSLYNGLSIVSVTASITDNDAAGVVVIESNGDTRVAEDGSVSDSYQVVLSSVPISTTTVAFATDGQVTVLSPILTFTMANWFIPQTVNVFAVQDNVSEYFHTGLITNTSSSLDPNYNNNIITVTVFITDDDVEADLAVVKTDSPDPAVLGQQITYIITVTNNGPWPATNLFITDTLPLAPGSSSLALAGPISYTVIFDDLTFDPPRPPTDGIGIAAVVCNLVSNIFSCQVDDLASNASMQLVIQVTPNSPGTLVNTVVVTATEFDPNLGNNTASTTTTVNLALIDLTLNKTSSTGTVLVGETLVYTLNVANNGSAPAIGVSLVDALPANLTIGSISTSQGNCNPSGGTVSCGLGTINNGASAQVTIAVTPTTAFTTPTLITNTANVTATVGADTNSSNNTDSVAVTVSPVTADLGISKTVSLTSTLVGQPVIYTLTITNAGPDLATGVNVTDVLPTGIQLTSAIPSQGTCTGASTVTCSLGTVSLAGAQIVLVITPTTVGTITNQAQVASSFITDPVPGNNTSNQVSTYVRERSFDLRLTKVASTSLITVGNTLLYTLTVENNILAQDPALNVTLTDPLPSGAAFGSTSGGSCSETSGTVTCNLGAIVPGGSQQVVLVVTPTAAITLVNAASVTSAPGSDVNLVDNAATATTTVAGLSGIISQTVGGTLIYTDAQGNPTQITVLPNSVTGTIRLVYTPLLGPSISPPAGTTNTGHNFTLEAYFYPPGTVLIPNYVFSQSITITITYSNNDITNVSDENGLLLYYRSGSSWVDVTTTCVPSTTYQHLTATNTIEVAICHLSEFGLFGPTSSQPVYLPIILKNNP